jgi:transposase
MNPPPTPHASPAHHPPHGCRACTHHGPLQRHATRHSWWRDVPQDGRPQYRRGHIVRWRCPVCGHTHAHQPEWALPGKRMTLALDAWLRQALTQGLSARAMALRCGLDAKTVRNWLRERACGTCRACDMGREQGRELGASAD